jgi:hypothetical protein
MSQRATNLKTEKREKHMSVNAEYIESILNGTCDFLGDYDYQMAMFDVEDGDLVVAMSYHLSERVKTKEEAIFAAQHVAKVAVMTFEFNLSEAGSDIDLSDAEVNVIL